MKFPILFLRTKKIFFCFCIPNLYYLLSTSNKIIVYSIYKRIKINIIYTITYINKYTINSYFYFNKIKSSFKILQLFQYHSSIIQNIYYTCYLFDLKGNYIPYISTLLGRIVLCIPHDPILFFSICNCISVFTFFEKKIFEQRILLQK